MSETFTTTLTDSLLITEKGNSYCSVQTKYLNVIQVFIRVEWVKFVMSWYGRFVKE